MKTSKEILEGIDYELLNNQKQILITMIQDWGECNDPDQIRDAREVEGLLNLLDDIQDYAIDSLGKDEKEVF